MSSRGGEDRFIKMDKSVNRDFWKKSFRYKVKRWEEWSGGQCISQGTIDLIIHAIDRGDAIDFVIDGHLRGLRVLPKSRFWYQLSTITAASNPYAGLIPDHPGVPGRISYNAPPQGNVYEEQFITELHFEDQRLAYIRFAFEGRILEFYGEVEGLATTFAQALYSGSNQPPTGRLVFVSPMHARFRGETLVGPPAEAVRHVVIEKNISGGAGYTVSVENSEGVHPLFGSNLQMSHKPMRVVEKDEDTVLLRGYGTDAFGVSFEDYAIVLNYDEGNLLSVSLLMLDRDTRILYFS